MDLFALLERPWSAALERTARELREQIPGEIARFGVAWSAAGFSDLRTQSGWVDLHDFGEPVAEPALPDPTLALVLSGGFRLEFGAYTTGIHSRLRWSTFLERADLREPALEVLRALCRVLGARRAVVCGDASPIAGAFDDGLDFDASLAAAAGAHAEVRTLDDLAREPEGYGYYAFWRNEGSGPMLPPEAQAVERVRRARTPRASAVPPGAHLADLSSSHLVSLDAMGSGSDRWHEARIEMRKASGSRGAIVCEYEQALAGFGCFRHFNPRKRFGRGSPELRWIEVLEPYRRRGIGAAIVRELERRCGRDRLHIAPIPASATDLRRFLRACGYRCSGATDVSLSYARRFIPSEL